MRRARTELIIPCIPVQQKVNYVFYMMKKFTFALSGLVVFGLAACEKQNATDEATAEPVAAEAPAAATEAAVEAPAAAATESSSLVKDYEKFVDEYIAIMKKVKAGDTAAIQEMTKFAEKAQEWATKSQTAIASATEADQAEFQRIVEKLTKALTE